MNTVTVVAELNMRNLVEFYFYAPIGIVLPHSIDSGQSFLGGANGNDRWLQGLYSSRVS